MKEILRALLISLGIGFVSTAVWALMTGAWCYIVYLIVKIFII